MTVTLSGCASSGRLAPAIDAEVPFSLVSSGGLGGEMPVTDAWWHAFGDETLNALVEQALADNFSLHSVRARVDRAQAVAGRSETGLIPALRRVGLVERRFDVRAGLWQYSADLVMSYDFEALEKLRAAVLPPDLHLLASQASLNAVSMSLSAEVANTYFAVIKNRAELNLLQDQLAGGREILALMTGEGNAKPRGDELIRQQQLIADAEAQSIWVEARQQTLTHQLAVLVGAPVSEFVLPDNLPPLQHLDPLPYQGVPAAWLMRRPDLQAAFLRMQSLSPDIARIVASRFPRVNLSALVSPAHLLEDWLLGLVSRISVPLLDRINIKFNTEMAATEQAEALANYRQEVLSAVREVEDAMVAEHRDRLLLRSLGERKALARSAVTQLKYRYANGAIDYFELFTAQRDLQALQQEHLSTQLALTLNRISVAHALAGSWLEPGQRLPAMLQSASPAEMLRQYRPALRKPAEAPDNALPG